MTQTPKSCCSPKRAGVHALLAAPDLDAREDMRPETAEIPGGMGLIGTNDQIFPIDEEGPMRKKRIKPFRIDVTTVTNARFAEFARSTGYQTEAERFGNSFVFHTHLPKDHPPTQGVLGSEWWRMVDGASWRRPLGALVDEDPDPDHPVVQVSWNDAMAFAKWAGGRLPSEAEWEHAARGGLGDVRFPWGDDEPNDKDFFPCNIWQGSFPHQNSGADGYIGTAPTKSFEPNGYGLYNMVGNVWEWTAEPFRLKSLKREAKAAMASKAGFKLQKGGSFLCHISYCFRYRIAARHGNAPDTATGHQGLRLVYEI